MANQVTDNRTDIADGTTVSGWEDIGGSAFSAVDTDIRYDTFSASIGNYATTTRDATMFNNAGTGLFASGDHAYLLINCGVVSLLDTKALGGLTVRVTGATITDWAEFELYGSDEWPTTFDGGWAQIVVDIDELLANPTNTNGTPPTVANIQRFGVTFITATVMPRMTDNFWVGGFRILGANTPAIIVEGRNGGATDWDWDSIRSVAAVQVSAVIKPGPGGSFVCRGPIQFGIDDTSTHAFTETNKTFLWDNQEVMLDGFYGLSALGNSGGTTNVTFGAKTGTLDDATGAQGGAIQAASTFSRFDMDFNDANVDGVNFYGVQLQHGGDFLLDDPAVSFISTSYVDCTSALVSNSEQLRCKIIDANTADDVAFMTTDDITDLVFCEFSFSDGHGVELTTPNTTSQTSKGNLFVGYGATTSTDAAVYNNSGAGLVTITLTDGASLSQHTYKDGTSATTAVTASVPVIFEAVNGLDVAIGTVRISAYLVSDDSEVINTTSTAGGIASTTFSGTTPADIYYKYKKSSAGDTKYVALSGFATIETNTGVSVKRSMREDTTADPTI